MSAGDSSKSNDERRMMKKKSDEIKRISDDFFIITHKQLSRVSKKEFGTIMACLLGGA